MGVSRLSQLGKHKFTFALKKSTKNSNEIKVLHFQAFFFVRLFFFYHIKGQTDS